MKYTIIYNNPPSPYYEVRWYEWYTNSFDEACDALTEARSEFLSDPDTYKDATAFIMKVE